MEYALPSYERAMRTEARDARLIEKGVLIGKIMTHKFRGRPLVDTIMFGTLRADQCEQILGMQSLGEVRAVWDGFTTGLAPSVGDARSNHYRYDRSYDIDITRMIQDGTGGYHSHTRFSRVQLISMIMSTFFDDWNDVNRNFRAGAHIMHVQTGMFGRIDLATCVRIVSLMTGPQLMAAIIKRNGADTMFM